MQLYPLHKELLEEALKLLGEKYADNPRMNQEVSALSDELRFEGMIDK